MEPEPTDSRVLAQCLHAGGLPEGLGRAPPPQIPAGHLHAHRRGTPSVTINELCRCARRRASLAEVGPSVSRRVSLMVRLLSVVGPVHAGRALPRVF